MRLDVLGQMFTVSLAFYLVYGGMKVDPSTVGFILSMAGKSPSLIVKRTRFKNISAVSFSELILWWVRIYNEFEGTVFL